MALKEKIQEDFKKALKEKKEIKLSTLRMLSAAIFNKEKEKRYNLSQERPELSAQDLEKESWLMDEEILEVVSSEIKKRKESISEFQKGQREDLAEKEKKELEILKQYLPEQLSKKEIEKLAREVIEKVQARDLKDMGKVMAQLMPKIKGRAVGNEVSDVVKELLKA